MAAATLAAAQPPAWAIDLSSPSPSWGPWLFVSVALLLVAMASFAAGLWRARRQSPAQQPSYSPAPAAASVPDPVATRPAAPELHDWARQLAADARPVLLLADDGQGGGRRLQHANATALRHLGLEAADVGRAWSELAKAVPHKLREILAEAGEEVPSEIEGWWLLRDPARRAVLALGSLDEGRADSDASLGYTVSHDLRAPIRVVEGFARIVKEDYGRQLDRMGNDHLDRVLAAAARMNQMIDAMLTMARLSSQPLVRQRVDLSQLASFIVDDLRRATPTREARIEIEPDLKAHGDPTLLRLVLENLIGNAWKYSERCEQAHIEFRCRVEQGQRNFIVQDNGAGFDMRVADRLFGLFQRLHSAKDFPGTGVGLASVRRIVQRHGGQVWAEATPGKGACFHFTLRD